MSASQYERAILNGNVRFKCSFANLPERIHLELMTQLKQIEETFCFLDIFFSLVMGTLDSTSYCGSPSTYRLTRACSYVSSRWALRISYLQLLDLICVEILEE
jgi:hypothetical protein